MLNLYHSQPQAVRLKTFHFLCCALLSQIKLLFRLYSYFSMYLIYSLITSWKCFIISHMSSSFRIGKQNSLFIQFDKKIWGLHRSKCHTSLQACKKAHRNCSCLTTYSKRLLCSLQVLSAVSGEKHLMRITTGSPAWTRVVTWVLPSNFSPEWWKKQNAGVNLSACND